MANVIVEKMCFRSLFIKSLEKWDMIYQSVLSTQTILQSPTKKIKIKKETIDLFALSLLLKNPSSSWLDLILLFFSGTEIESLANKFCLSGVELLYR